MKKVYTTIFLFVSLFFFCSHNVSAATYEYTLSEESIALINDDFYTIRDLAIQYAEENNSYYWIYRDDYSLKVKFFTSPYTLKFTSSTDYHRLSFKASDTSVYVVNNGELKSNSIIISNMQDFTFVDNVINLNEILDTNYDFIYPNTEDISISYMDYTYTVNSGSIFPSVYHFYLNTIGKPDIHEEEKEILSNFYTLVIEKINLLAISIINNYIYLTVIGIFILIFVICLIRRYLL